MRVAYRAGCVLVVSGFLFVIPAAASLLDVLTVYAPDSSVYESVSVDQSIEDPSAVYEISDTSIANTSEFGNATTLCNTACNSSSPTGDYTDIFGVVFDSGNYYLGFSADDAGGETFGAFGSTFLVNNGAPFSATEYLNSTLQQQGYTATFQTGVSPTPEPSTTLTLLTGLAVMIFGRRFRASLAGRPR